MKITKWLNKLEGVIQDAMMYKPYDEIKDVVYLHHLRCDLAKLNMVLLRKDKVPPEKYFKLYEACVGLIDNLDVALGNELWYNIQLKENGQQLLNAIRVNKELERNHK